MENRFAYQVRSRQYGRDNEGHKDGFRLGGRSRLVDKKSDEKDSEWQVRQSGERPNRHDGGVCETFGILPESGMADNHRVGSDWRFAMCIGVDTVAMVGCSLGGKPIFGTFAQNGATRRTSRTACSLVPRIAGRVTAALFVGRIEGERICDHPVPKDMLEFVHAVPDDCASCGFGPGLTHQNSAASLF